MINNASIRLQRYTLNQLLWRLCGYNQLFWVDNSCHNNEKHVRQQHRNSDINYSHVGRHARKGRILLQFCDQIQWSRHQIFTQMHSTVSIRSSHIKSPSEFLQEPPPPTSNGVSPHLTVKLFHPAVSPFFLDSSKLTKLGLLSTPSTVFNKAVIWTMPCREKTLVLCDEFLLFSILSRWSRIDAVMLQQFVSNIKFVKCNPADIPLPFNNATSFCPEIP